MLMFLFFFPFIFYFIFQTKISKVPVITPKKTGKRRRKIQSRKNIGFFNTNLVFDCGGLSSVENLKPHVIEKVNDSLWCAYFFLFHFGIDFFFFFEMGIEIIFSYYIKTLNIINNISIQHIIVNGLSKLKP